MHNRWAVKEEELYEPTKRYRIGTQTYAEGMYVTAARTIPKLLKAILKDLTKMQRDLQRTEWSQLSKHERANIIKTVSELGFGVVLFTLGSVLRGEAEDDEDNAYLYYLSFQANRLYTELYAYVSITEMMRILQSPMATITMIERVKMLVSQLVEDVFWNLGEWETYQSGTRKGKSKISKSIQDVIPFWKHGTRHEHLADVVNYYYK